MPWCRRGTSNSGFLAYHSEPETIPPPPHLPPGGRWFGRRRRRTAVLLLAFVVPYWAKTMMWIGVNRSQAAIVYATEQLQVATAALEASQEPNAATLRQITARLAETKVCLADECVEYRVWQVVLGIDKGWRFWILALLLLTYNGCRAGLTWQVGPLRDEEERSGYSPAWSEYRWLFWAHRVVRVLMWLGLIALAWHGWEWLFNTRVSLPAG